MHLAAAEGHTELLREMLARAPHRARVNDETDVRNLLDPNTNLVHVDGNSFHGLTPLHLSVSRGHLETVRLLLENQADIT